MSMDRTFKRAFPVVVLLGLALVAYFQARGLGYLFGASISDTPAPATSNHAVATPSSTSPTGTPILDRNPFGPEPAASAPEPKLDGDETPAEPDEKDTSCDFARVVLITSSDDPRWSFASISGAAGDVKMRRVGDDVDDWKVHEITSNRVWLKKGSRRCSLQMGRSSPKDNAPTHEAAGAPDWKTQIRRLNDGEVVIERAAAEAIAASPAGLMGTARMRPELEGDRTVGLRLSRVRRGTLLDALGLKNGDRLESINGQALDDPRKVMELYERFAKLDRWSLRLVRNGAPRTIRYRIR